MKKIISFLLLLSIFSAFSQQIPRIKVKNEKDLKLTGLKITIDIVGNYAKTTYDMMFYNPNNRILEGELVFPLAQGQSVSDFSMEVNGYMRKAVVVEKTQARVAYKNTMVRRIDPGLLEKTEGNNYKARIYPINAQSYKHVIIGVEELLPSENSEKIYSGALDFRDKLKYFELDISVASNNKPYFQPNPFGDLHFKKKQGKYVAHWERKKYTPKQSFRIFIPESFQQPEVIRYQDYFYVYVPLQKNFKPKPKPKHIAVYWDASLSGLKRDVDTEIQLLSDYVKYLNNVDMDIYVFSSGLRQTYTMKIENGKTQVLKNILNSIVYDGGTAFSLLDDIDTQNVDEILLFSDGLNNLGNWSKLPDIPVYTINSSVNAHHDGLQQIADQTGGDYLNLNRIDVPTALDNLKILPLKYLGVSPKEQLFEVYPAHSKTVSGSFVLAGRFFEPVKFKINFGYGKEVTSAYPVDLATAVEDALAKRLWAMQKLSDLQSDRKKNKKKIIGLATRYHLMSDYTSMIILDRIEDYVRYGIEPPEELKSRYKDYLASWQKRTETEKENEVRVFEALKWNYHKIIGWYNRDQVENLKKSKNDDRTEWRNDEQEYEDVRRTPRRSGTRPFSGFVYDKSTIDPLPGVNVLIKGTEYGTATDFDGKFNIGVKTGDTLEFKYVGYKTKEHVVGNENSIEIYLLEGEILYEAVTVTALGARAERRSRRRDERKFVGSSNVRAKAIGDNNVESLSGRVAGISVSEPVNMEPGSTYNIVVRGAGSIRNGDEPLFVLDGEIVKNDYLKDLNPDDIAKIFVMKFPLSVNTYGRKGRNGVILIYTKKYYQQHRSEVISMEQLIGDRQEAKAVKTSDDYMNSLKSAKNADEAYRFYLNMRDEYMNKPVFFIDVSDYFYKLGKEDIAVQIITNLLELKLANHELSRALAYKLEAYGRYDMAVKVYQNVLELRPEEPQSYRDLALAYEQAGEYQKSFDLLYNMYKGKYTEISGNTRYAGIEDIAFVELHHLVNLHGDQIKLPEDARIFKKLMPMDIRVVIDWNHNDTDIDLWVFDPNDEKAYYKHKHTEIGGRMSNDFVNGYGPESFSLKNAIKGVYNFEVNYYADSKQKVSGPTILKITIFKNYGKTNEERKVILASLDKGDNHLEVGNLKF